MNEKEKTTVADLLRDPGLCIVRSQNAQNLGGLVAFLLSVAIIGSGAFGFALGAFAGWREALVDALKMMGVVLFPFVLCAPTLYVFSCLGGCTLNPLRLLTVGLVALAVLGCLLAALAPVLWLFAVSTESMVFIVFFACALAAVAAHFAHRPLFCAVERKVVGSVTVLRVWFLIFLLVALQTVTLMRPMLSPLGSSRSPQGKCFFLEHLQHSVFNAR